MKIPTMSDIIAFVKKAMEKNMSMSTIYREFSVLEEYVINIYKNEDSCLTIQYLHPQGKERTLSITTNYLDWIKIENISELDCAKFKTLVLEIAEYSENKVLEDFNNFFEEEKSKVTDINDLDNEDE